MFKNIKELRRLEKERLEQKALDTRTDVLLQSIPISPYVSVEHKYCAMITPKAACSTIRRALLAWEGFGVMPDLKIDDIHLMGPAMRLENKPWGLAQEMLLSPDYYRFCFVRNPYDRMVSFWKSKIRTDHPQYLQLQADIRKAYGCKQVALHHLIDYVISSDDQDVVYDHHLLDQTILLLPDLVDYNRVGRFETFNSDFAEILRELGAPEDIVRIGVSKTNFTQKMKPQYSQEMADKVYALTRDSFEAFGYDKDSWNLY